MSGSQILHIEISKLYKGEVLNFVAITDQGFSYKNHFEYLNRRISNSEYRTFTN